jgi:hypothetical protein
VRQTKQLANRQTTNNAEVEDAKEEYFKTTVPNYNNYYLEIKLFLPQKYFY